MAEMRLFLATPITSRDEDNRLAWWLKMAVRSRVSVLFVVVCEFLLRSSLLVCFGLHPFHHRCSASRMCGFLNTTGIISSLAGRDEVWEIVIRPKV